MMGCTDGPHCVEEGALLHQTLKGPFHLKGPGRVGWGGAVLATGDEIPGQEEKRRTAGDLGGRAGLAGALERAACGEGGWKAELSNGGHAGPGALTTWRAAAEQVVWPPRWAEVPRAHLPP